MDFKKIIENKENVLNKYGENVNIDSIMILDNEEMFEHFYKNDDLHQMRSISKVLVSLAYGIAIDREMIKTDEFVYPYLYNFVEIKNKNNLEKIKKWQVKHLLTYSCGFAEQMFSERFIEGLEPSNYLNYVVNYDLKFEPGEKYVYNNADIFLLSVYFQNKLNQNLTDFVASEIFKPLGINNFVWDNYDVYNPGGTGLYLTHKDLFKIGQLILNKGVFGGKQIVSATYIEKMCSPQIETPYAIKKERVLPKFAVGYVMHISRDGYVYKDGAEGQYLIINFDKKQLITILSTEKDMACVTDILRDII